MRLVTDFSTAKFSARKTIEQHLEGIQEKTVWVKDFIAKLSFKFEHFLKTLLENGIQASQEMAGETLVNGLEISAHWHSP